MPQLADEHAATRREQRSDLPIEFRSAPLNAGSIDAKARTVRCVFSTGARVRRYDWYHERWYQEELVVTPEAVRLDRLRSGAPLLDSHSQWSLRDVLGVASEPAIAGGEASALLRFSQRAEVAPIWQDVQDRILPNVSVGYRRHRVERVAPAKDGEDWLYRVVDWEPYEISLVPIGADAGAQIRSGAASQDERRFPCTFIDVSERSFPVSEENASAASSTSRPADAAAVTRAVAAERERVQFINDAARRYNLGADFVRHMINDETCDLLEARGRVHDELARRGQAMPQRSAAYLPDSYMFSYSNFDGETLNGQRDTLIAAQLQKLGGPKAPPEARRYLRMTQKQIAEELERMRGVNPENLTEGELWGRANHTTADFSNLTGVAVHKWVLINFDQAGAALKRVAAKSTAPDFKAKTMIRMSTFPRLTKVNEHGEVKSGASGDSSETYKMDTYASMMGITRQAEINDDMGALSDLGRMAGLAAADFEAQLMTDHLTLASGAGPVMSDGVALFHASHGNLAASGAAIGFNTLNAGRLAMRLQKHIDKTTLINAYPAYVVIPPSLESTCEKELATIAATKTADFNPFGGKLEMVVEPRLEAVSSAAWYMVAAPGRVPGLEYSYMDGAEGPQVEQRLGWEILGIQWRVYLDIGVGFVDHRGWYRNAGA